MAKKEKVVTHEKGEKAAQEKTWPGTACPREKKRKDFSPHFREKKKKGVRTERKDRDRPTPPKGICGRERAGSRCSPPTSEDGMAAL